MAIEQQPFTKYRLDSEGSIDSFTVRLNEEERKLFEEDKKILEQEKDSTAIKQLARIGSNVLRDPQMASILGIVFKNKRNN